MAVSFLEACELREMIAGPADWDAFALAFDDVLKDLDACDLHAISQFIDGRHVAKLQDPGFAPLTAPSRPFRRSGDRFVAE